MLWYKSWLETRWRFLIGFAVIACSAAGTVFIYPQVLKLMPLVPTNIGGEIGRQIREGAALAKSYSGYVWSQAYRKNLCQIATLFAVLLGTASVLSHSGGALFTLSLPVSRKRILAVRAATGLAELFVLALIPAIVIPMLSPAVGGTYNVGTALIHSLCLFVATTVFFGLAFLLSTIFGDPWRPSLIALAIAFGISLFEQLSRTQGVFAVMSGESYFRNGHLPWPGLLASAAVAAALYYSAVASLARRDF